MLQFMGHEAQQRKSERVKFQRTLGVGSVEMNGNVMVKETAQLGMVGSRIAVAVETLV